MSMQVDFQYPRQVEDVASVKAAVRGFDKEMRKMMLLMKELGNTFEGVSRSFSALTSLTYVDDEQIRRYVDGFSENIVRMKEGAAFQDYNRLVHEEVLAPVNALKHALKETETAIKHREHAYRAYTSAKKIVDKTERSYAAKNKVLEDSKSYPARKAKREEELANFQAKSSAFQETFLAFVQKVEVVTKSTMHRYLALNAGYMTAVVDALTTTDPSVEQHVDLYRRQRAAERSTEIARRQREVDEEMMSGGGAPTSAEASFNYNGSAVASCQQRSNNSGKAVQPAAATLPDSLVKQRYDLKQSEGTKPKAGGPPTAVVQEQQQQQPQVQSVTAAASMSPSKANEPATIPNATRTSPNAAAAVSVPAAAIVPNSEKSGSLAEATDRHGDRLDAQRQRHAEEVDQRMNAVASCVPPDDVDDDDGDGQESYFGSVSQINDAQQLRARRLKLAALAAAGGAAGDAGAVDISVGGPATSEYQRAAKTTAYRFAPSTVAGASHVSGGGYMAAQTDEIEKNFRAGLEPADPSTRE